MQLSNNFKRLPLESQIIFLIGSFAFARIVFALMEDFYAGVSVYVILIDILILLVVAYLIYLSWGGHIRHISILVGLLIALLLAVNFLQFGGISGYTKFNYYIGIYVIVILYSRWKLRITIAFSLLLLAGIIILDYTNPLIRQIFFERLTPQIKDFWFSITIVSGIGYYLKHMTDLYGEKLFSLNNDLAERIRQTRKLNQLLQTKNEELNEAQGHLEQEISRRSEVLEGKNNSIENFLMVNTSHLVDPVKDLIDAVRARENNSVLSNLLKQSADDLERVSYSIREAIQTQPLIDRRKIK